LVDREQAPKNLVLDGNQFIADPGGQSAVHQKLNPVPLFLSLTG
jgi:hypothetical protein